jgi:hypothetical protein
MTTDTETLVREVHQTLENLPVEDGAWIGARRPIEIKAMGFDGVDLCMWVEARSEVARAIQFVPRGEEPELLGRLLLRAMLDPAGGRPACRPTLLRVTDADHSEQIDEVAATFEIERESEGDFAIVERLVTQLEQDVHRNRTLDYLARTGVDARAVRLFCLSAVEFQKAEPWRHTPSRKMVKVEGLSISPIYVAVLGQEEGDTGARICLTEEAARTEFTEDAPVTAPVLQFTLGLVDEGTSVMRQQARKNRWAMTSPGTIPVLLRLDRAEGDRLPTREEHVLAADVLEAVTRIDAAFSRRQDKSVTLSSGRKVGVRWPVRFGADGTPLAEDVAIEFAIAPRGSTEAPIQERIMSDVSLAGLHDMLSEESDAEWTITLGDRVYSPHVAPQTELADLDLPVGADLHYTSGEFDLELKVVDRSK